MPLTLPPHTLVSVCVDALLDPVSEKRFLCPPFLTKLRLCYYRLDAQFALLPIIPLPLCSLLPLTAASVSASVVCPFYHTRKVTSRIITMEMIDSYVVDSFNHLVAVIGAGISIFVLARTVASTLSPQNGRIFQYVTQI